MVSLISSPNFKISQHPISIMNLPHTFPIFLVINPPIIERQLRLTRKKKKQKNLLSLEFNEYYGVVTMCCKWESENITELELEVLEFMMNSKTPKKFPTKNELIEAGRLDLVEAIKTRGGWMSMGWYDVDEVEIENGFVQSFDFGSEMCGKNDGYDGKEKCVTNELREGKNDVDSSSVLDNSSSSGESSSGQSLEVERGDDGGIEGILYRLERQRNLSFGINFEKNGNMNNGFKEQSNGSSIDVDSCRPEGSVLASPGLDGPLYSGNGTVRSYSKSLNSSLKADTWRAWSFQRAGYADKEFEAAEIDFGGSLDKKTPVDLVGQTVAVPTDIKGGLDVTEDLESLVNEIAQTDMKSRLQHLKWELSSALHSLTSNTTDLSEKCQAEDRSPDDLRQLSDASEFQENEIMQIQNKLRSMRANLAVLEGKMALAIIDAHKILEEKQKRIDDARAALQLLRTTYIVWPNSGSEVLLAGSFDGWATQRKMERSSSGIFSLGLKLYPGQYEIKFIVDGAWMLDPLRPIVNHSGYDNNLLIIT